MVSPECADAREHAASAADLEVRAPDLGPAALQRHAARNCLGLEPLGPRLCAKRTFQARGGHEEDLEVAVCRHRA